MNEQRNLILAVILATLIWLGFNYFYERPRQEMIRHNMELTQQTQEKSLAPRKDAPFPSVKVTLPLREALQVSPRLSIKTDRVKGSINLKGCRLDDLLLLNYQETIQPSSAPITLLSPEGAKGAYYADFGWRSSQADIKLPDTETVWNTSQSELSQNNPVILTWHNGDGLEFQRTIQVDEHYMFTITDTVVNASGQPVYKQ